jgi:hypothetical protein
MRRRARRSPRAVGRADRNAAGLAVGSNQTSRDGLAGRPAAPSPARPSGAELDGGVAVASFLDRARWLAGHVPALVVERERAAVVVERARAAVTIEREVRGQAELAVAHDAADQRPGHGPPPTLEPQRAASGARAAADHERALRALRMARARRLALALVAGAARLR